MRKFQGNGSTAVEELLCPFRELIKSSEPKNLEKNCAGKVPGMEFRFNVNPLFRTNIISVDSNLVPVGYAGTKRDYM